LPRSAGQGRPERELAERYRKRAEQTGRHIGFRDMDVVEIRESRAQEVGKRMIEESTRWPI